MNSGGVFAGGGRLVFDPSAFRWAKFTDDELLALRFCLQAVPADKIELSRITDMLCQIQDEIEERPNRRFSTGESEGGTVLG